MSVTWNSARAAELKRLVTDDPLARFAGWCSVVYISLYALEAPIRYGLYFVHMSNLIVSRDLLMWVPVLLIAGRGVLRRDLHPAFLVFGAFVGIGSVVSILNFGTVTPAAFAVKILLNSLYGLVAGSMLVIPSKALGRYLLILWMVTVAALVLEKYAVSYPWVGLHDTIAGVDVELSRDWQIDDPGSKRVGGLTRSSIQAAVLVSELALVSVFLIRPYIIRLAILAATIGSIYLTTQKGALIGFTLVSAAILGPPKWRLPSLRILTLLAVILDIGLPLGTNGMFVAQGNGGVFSGASFALRIVDAWPKTLEWIDRWQLFPLGVGLGGAGLGLQFLGNIEPLYTDNVFLLLYSFFGIPSLALFGWVIYGVVRSLSLDPEIAAPGLAILAFGLLYGVVVSLVEDPACALFTLAGLGLLLQARRVPDLQPKSDMLRRREQRFRYRQPPQLG